MEQLERSKWINVHWCAPVFGCTFIVLTVSFTVVLLLSSTYVSDVAAEPVNVHVAFVSVCEPAHMCHEPTLSVAAKPAAEPTPSVAATRIASRRMFMPPPPRS